MIIGEDVGAHKAWIRNGAAASLALAVLFACLRRWKTARLFAAFALGFLEKWRETRLAAQVGTLLAKAGRET